ncbi:Valine--tRNA ligase [Acorus calamus]|uniref:valine--tRNA ligase n=1 Tax=Acorus calamus TaxID=4465 RepID=A0AAV9DL34_ACOCL|nr:Valine--tRNA ligase [Acorus calamus]
MEEDPERKKKKEEKAREKELKKLKALQKAEAAKNQLMSADSQSQQKPSSKKSEKKNQRRGGGAEEEKPEDFIDPETPNGEKKKLSPVMAKQYSPSTVEKAWYAWWEKSNFFRADADSKKTPFVIVVPPPNVTGALHIGHGLTASIEDLIIRWRRMSAYNTLWVPGMDHAGIATQVVVEKKIMRERKQTRHDVGREAFVNEVDYKDIKERTLLKVPGYQDPVEFGVLTSFAYPLEGELGEIVVATTRVETMLGDTAIAIHPEDKRYSHLHGKFAIHPFNGRKLPIICDAILVDPEFGTGAVKITPAHDPNDFDVGKRHCLEFINIFTDDGNINSNGGSNFEGMPRFKARLAVVEALKEKGLYIGAQNNEMRLGICSRTNDVVEPMIKPQWFVNCQSMAKEALDAVMDENNRKIEIIPKQYAQEWKRWLENIRDWCISRQLWWGHRIPAWYVILEDDQLKEIGAYNDHWVVGRNEEEALSEAFGKFQEKKFHIEQDPDVMCHAIVHQISIFATKLISLPFQSDKINLDIQRVVGYRQWCNKLWNAIRFAMNKLGDDYCPPVNIEVQQMPFSCKWILSVLNKAISKTVSSLEAYEFSDAATVVYSWWQFQLCDVFIEVIKPYFSAESKFDDSRKASRDALWVCLDTGLRLLHPFMPFVTEELWQRLPQVAGSCNRRESIVISEYPSVVDAWTNEPVEREMGLIESIVKSIRSLRSMMLPNERNERRPAYVMCHVDVVSDTIRRYELEISNLASFSSLKVLSENDGAPAGCSVSVVNEQISVYLQLQGNLNAEAEREKLQKKREELQKQHDNLEKKMSASGYKEKVPQNIHEDNLKKLNKLLQELGIIDEADRKLIDMGNGEN